MFHFFFIVIISPKCPTTVWLLSASGADERGTHPLDKAVSHTDPSENTLSRGLLWDTLAKSHRVITSSAPLIPHANHSVAASVSFMTFTSLISLLFMP